MKIAQLNPDYSQQLVASGTVGSSTGGDVSGPLPGPITVTGIGGVTVDTPDGIATDYLNGAGHWTTPAGSGGSGFVTNVGGGKEVINTIAASGASHTLDLTLGNVQDVTLTAACTLAFTGATAGVFCSFELFLRQDGTGGWATTWPGSVIWPGGTEPTLDTTPSSVTVLAFGSEDGGTTWYGFPSHGGGALLNPATLPEISSPSTPGSGNVYLYAKSDGRVYSKSPGGIEYGPFDMAGAGGLVNPADFRLSGVRDDPTSIPAGAYGNEFEYTSKSALAAVWAPTLSLTDYYINGSSAMFTSQGTSGRGFVFQLGSNLPTDFEVAVLLSGAYTQNGMTGLAIVDSSGTGIGCSPYPGYGYTWDVTTYVYSGTRTNAAGPTSAQTLAPHWLALRRQSSTTWRFRWSADGTTWNTIIAADTKTVTNAQGIFIGSMYSGNATELISIHRIVYGTPDLGL